MPYEPLHHKYRPATFADLVGQEAIAQTLVSAIRQQKIAPAYLFTGSRGTGKTSSARIMAKSLNCLQSPQPTETPCGTCESCRSIANGMALDVIEIDAASNTGVDNIREIIERAQFAPVQCRYKVYAIDECHMLSTAAFNALLKTLEEPPDRVIFILATTDPQRVLPTIISRCQRFDFRRIAQDSMVQHLRKIADLEEISIEEEAIVRVAQIAQGGLRDAESVLDQLSLNNETITPQHVWDLVGAVPERDLLSLLQAIITDRPDVLLEQARQLMDRGREPPIVLQNLAGFYRDLSIAKTSPDRNDLVALAPHTWTQLCQLARELDLGAILAGGQHLRSCETQLRNTTQPRLWLEVALLGLLPSRLQFQPPTRAANPHQPLNPSPSHYPAQNSPAQNSPAQNSPAPTSQNNGLPIGGYSAEASPNPTAPHNGNGAAQYPNASAPTHPPTNSMGSGMGASSDRQPETPISQPDPNGQGVQSTPATPTIQVGEQNLVTIWQQVLELIAMRATRELFRQQGQLVALEGSVAQIAVVAGLIAIATSKAKDLEAAFERAFDRTIRVKIEAIGSHSPPVASQPAVSQPAVSQPAVSQPAMSQPAVSQPAVSQPIANPAPTTPVAPTPISPLAASTPVASTPVALTSDAPAPPAPISSEIWEEDEVLSAANRLAEFFNGEVIAMDDEFEEL